MSLMILCDKYSQNHHKASMAYNDMKASEYRMMTEQYKSETARLNLELTEAKIKAFVKAYGGQSEN